MMFRAIIAVTLLCSLSIFSVAQCPGCMPDFGCVVAMPNGGICDSTLLDANVGAVYQDDVSFYMPKTISSPLGNATLNEVQLTGITGLPFGLTWECDASGNQCKYFPQSMPIGQEVGCIRFCGTPLDNPGLYTVRAAIKAKATQGSITVIQDTAYYTTIMLLPGVSGNSSFSWSPSFGCDMDSFAFQGLLNGAPNFTTWQWDFGNGNTSSLQFPPKQFYTTGSYIVTCQTDIYEYIITDVDLLRVNDNYCGDIEELFCNCGTPIIGVCPEPYFIISDGGGAGIYSSNSLGGTTSGNWPGLSISLNNPGYVLTLFDEDNGPPLGSQDDTLGIMAFNPTATGIINLKAGESGGDTTELNLTISQQIAYSVIDTDTVHVYVAPTPMANLAGNDSICTGDSTQLSASSSAAYQWQLNGNDINGATGQNYWAKMGGNYAVTVLSADGCTGLSNVINIVELALPPIPNFVFNTANNTLSATNHQGFSLQWLFNGTPIAGAIDTTYIANTSGNYALVYSNELGCNITSNIQAIMANPSSLFNVNINYLNVYPNPNNGAFEIKSEGALSQIQIFSTNGELVFEKQNINAKGQRISLENASMGTYFIVAQTDIGTIYKKLLVQ